MVCMKCSFGQKKNVFVRFVDIVDGQDSEVVVIVRIVQGDVSIGFDIKSVDLCLVDVEGNGYGEEDFVGEVVVGNDIVFCQLLLFLQDLIG